MPHVTQIMQEILKKLMWMNNFEIENLETLGKCTISCRCRINRGRSRSRKDHHRVSRQRAQRAEGSLGVEIARGHGLFGQNSENNREF